MKEEYIGYLFNLCSEYIDIIDKYQRQIARKIKTGTTADIDKLLSTPYRTPISNLSTANSIQSFSTFFPTL